MAVRIPPFSSRLRPFFLSDSGELGPYGIEGKAQFGHATSSGKVKVSGEVGATSSGPTASAQVSAEGCAQASCIGGSAVPSANSPYYETKGAQQDTKVAGEDPPGEAGWGVSGSAGASVGEEVTVDVSINPSDAVHDVGCAVRGCDAKWACSERKWR